MKPKLMLVIVATVAVICGCGAGQASVARDHSGQPATTRSGPARAAQAAATHPAAKHPRRQHRSAAPSASPRSSADPTVTWLESAGGQEQVTFNDDVSTLAGDLEVESRSPTVANHLVFEADARVMRAEAEKILATPALLPAVNRPAYEQMLRDFIIVANLLQPGPGYGTTAQDWTAWNRAQAASNIVVS